jgi:sugar lactone lactonase YvrE
VDIISGHVHRYDLLAGEDAVTAVGVPVGAVAVRRGGGLVLAAARGFTFLDERTGSLEWLWVGARGDRMNDGKCDPAGRFLAGTLTSARVAGALYRLDTDGRVSVLIENVTLSNGLEWSPDDTRLYFADTTLERVDLLDYDVSTGMVRARRMFADLRDVAGRPGGLTVDADGGVWIDGPRRHGSAATRRTAGSITWSNCRYP